MSNPTNAWYNSPSYLAVMASLTKLKNMKQSIGNSWPKVNNSRQLQKKNNQVRAEKRNIPGEASIEVARRKSEFDSLVASINITLVTYEIIRVNSINLFDSYNNYVTENKKLEKQVNVTSSDIQTNDRKTYYQNEATDSLDLYYTILLFFYILTVIGFVVCWFMLPTALSSPKILFLFICIFLYPLFSTRILQYIMYLYNLALDYLPKNANKNA
jgi:hypothetical protein